MPDDKFVLIGPPGWQLLGLVVIMAVIAWWLMRTPNASSSPSFIGLLWQALTWRLVPALRTWYEQNREHAVNRFASDQANNRSSEVGNTDTDLAIAELETTTATSQQQCIAMGTTDSNALLLQAKAEALAAMVKAGAVGETKGLQIVFGVKPSSTNPRYLAARDALKNELVKLDKPRFRPLTPEQEKMREELGLPKR